MRKIRFIIFLGIIIAIIQSSCSFPIRKESTLRDESRFLYLEGGSIPVPVLKDESLDSENHRILRGQFNNLNYPDRNNYYVLSAKLGKIDIAEIGFQELIRERPNTREPFLNLVHMYFILEEYRSAKDTIASWIEKNRFPLSEFKPIMQKMEDELRIDERGMYLEAVSASSGYELYAWQELGKYFLYKKDYDSAEFYLQKVLESVPFDEDALVSMLELCVDSKRWSEVIDYGKALHLTSKGKSKSHFFIGKGYFESQNYKKAIEWLEKAPDTEKNQLDFLLLWRDSLLADNPGNSLVPLRRHLRVLQDNGLKVTEEELLPTLNPHGKEIMDGYLR